MPAYETPRILNLRRDRVTGGVGSGVTPMAGADEAKGTSVLTDWEGTVDAAIRIHECIHHRLQGLQGAWAGLGTVRGDGEQATGGKGRDGAQQDIDDKAPTRGNVGRQHNHHEYNAACTRTV